MKKWFSFILVMVLALVLIGCGGKEEEPEPTPGPTPAVEDVKPTSIEISGQKEEIEIGEDFTITVKVLPDNASNKKVRYSSSNSSVASVKDGKVTGVSAGTATITVTADADKTVKKEFTVTVKPGQEDTPPEPEIIPPTELEIGGGTEVQVSKMLNLQVTYTPTNATKGLTWTSSDEAIATVNNGIVKGIKEGEVTITATSTIDANIKATIVIKVIPTQEVVVIKPESITLNGEEEVEVGYSIRLSATVLPDGADNTIRWESTKPEIATIDEKGIVTGVSEGTTYIIAYSVADETVKSSRYKVKVNIDQSSLIPVNDLGGYEIVIMQADSALSSIDPFLEDYTATDKMYKQRAWEEVKSKYNCNISVVAYPDDAPWGPSRVSWINSQAENGKALADFYIVTSTWFPQFYAANAMQATTTYFAKFGKNQIEPAVRQSASYKNDLYIVSTGINQTTIYPYYGIFYNVGMLEKYKIESPAKMFNEGRWSYDDFLDWVLSAQALLPQGYYVLSGAPQDYWQGMVSASGVRIANTTTMELNFTHKYSVEAIDVLKSTQLAGAFDPVYGYDQGVASFQGGTALCQDGELWFVKASNRFPTDMWGEDTRYGYVPFPYAASVGKERSYVNAVGESCYMMAAQRTYNHKAGMTYEDVFRVMQEMFLNTIKYQQQDASFDAEGIKSQVLSAKFDDPESVTACMFYTAEKTLFDPIFNGIALNYSGAPATTISSVVKNNTDFIEAIDAAYNDIYLKFLELYA